jgi:metal-responsive CopG/Arc/MetJ family transcriptional regulator
MKTAISVENSLMEEADVAARDLGLSRSGLIAEALREYLKRRRRARVSERLNIAYSDGADPGERQLVRKLRTKLPAPDRW